jgi:hypothetical protein
MLEVARAGMAGRVVQRFTVTIPYRCVPTMLRNMDRAGLGGMTVALPVGHARPEIVVRSCSTG